MSAADSKRRLRPRRSFPEGVAFGRRSGTHRGTTRVKRRSRPNPQRLWRSPADCQHASGLQVEHPVFGPRVAVRPRGYN